MFTIGEISVAAILLVVIGATLAYFLAKYRHQIEFLEEAQEHFAFIFNPVKSAIIQFDDRLRATDIIEILLQRNFSDQRFAMQRLSKRLGFIKRKSFAKAWQEYVDPKDSGQDQFRSYYGLPSETGKELYHKDYLLKAVDRLLSFTK